MIDSIIDALIQLIPMAFVAFVAVREMARVSRPVNAAIVQIQPEPIQPESIQPVQPEPSRIDAMIAAARSVALRKFCSEAGIRWRDIHGPNRHMTANEMRMALMAVGNLNLPWLSV